MVTKVIMKWGLNFFLFLVFMFHFSPAHSPVVMKAVRPQQVFSMGITSRSSFRSSRRSLVRPHVAVPTTPATLEPAASSSNPDTPTPTPTPASIALHVRINDSWYDLRKWRDAHPAGPHWIDMFKDRDATEVFYAFHSETAQKILSRMPKLEDEPAVAQSVPPPSALTTEFRALRDQLIQEGWFERDWLKEFALYASWLGLVASGVAMGWSDWGLLRALAFLPLGLSFTAAGWTAHDMIHGRGKFCDIMRHFGGYAAGFSATMWSNKHNTHHAVTNVQGMDEDLSGGPLLWLWAPDPSRDKPWRPFQAIYVFFLFSFLHVIWRIDSIRTVMDDKPKLFLSEGLPILAHYVVYSLLVGPGTLFAAVLFGGWVMANVTSSTHQSEDLRTRPDDCWVRMQFDTTRNAVNRGLLTEWLWGGMQWQLEHHLFPTMPRYRYKALIPRIKALAAKHNVQYREDDEWEMIFRNYRNYARVGGEPAVVGAPLPRSGKSI